MIYVGIDIAKLNHFAAAISSDGEILIEPFKFTNDYDGFYLLLSKLAPLDQNSIIIGLEMITAEPTFAYMIKTQERVVDFIVEHSHASRADIEAKMNCTDNMANDVGTLLFGPEAAEMGLVDEIGTLSEAIRKLRSMISLDNLENNG